MEVMINIPATKMESVQHRVLSFPNRPQMQIVQQIVVSNQGDKQVLYAL